MNKKVLLFAAYFPPRRRVGSLRPYRFAIQLQKLGWEVHVVSIKESTSSLTDTESKALSGIHQFEVEPPFDNTASSKSSAGKKKSGGISDLIDRNFPIDTWWPFFWQKRKEIEQHVASIKPDIMWSTSDPWSVNHTARKIAQKFGIPWVADFRDPWTLCSVRYGSRPWAAGYIDRKSEGNILQDADHITFTAASTLKKYQQNYPQLKHKSSVIYNSFEQQHQNPDRSVELSNIQEDKLNILFLGVFRALSKAESILRVLIRFKEEYPEHLDELRIFSMGDLSGSDLDSAIDHGLEEIFVRLDRVPHTQVPALINHFDVNLLSTHPGRDDIIPAKLYDYLASDNPIFSLAPNPEVGEIIQQTRAGAHFNSHQVSEAADYLFRLVKLKKEANLRAERVNVDTEALKPFTAEATTTRLEGIFNQILNDGK